MNRNATGPTNGQRGGPRARWRGLLGLLELQRFELAAVAVSNAWVTLWLSRAWSQQLPGEAEAQAHSLSLAVALVVTALAAGGLAVFGVALNDLVDARLDSAMGRPRPLAGGGVSRASAQGLALVSLLVGVGAAAWLGRWPAMLAVAAAGGVVFYNLAGRFVPAVGLVVLGVVFAASRMVPEPAFAFLWPGVLTLAHVCGCGAIAHVLRGRRPRLSARGVTLLVLGWGFATLVLVVWMRQQGGLLVPGQPLLWLGPVIGVGVFLLIALALVRGRGRHGTSVGLGRLALAWLVVYDIGWLVGAGQWAGAGVAALLLIFVVVWPRVVRR